MLERKHRVSTKVTAMKSYGIELLFTHNKNGDSGAISETEGSCAAPISKAERHMSDWFRTVTEVNK